MKNSNMLVIPAMFMLACVPQYRLVYSSGFSYTKYDYVVVAKPDPTGTSTSLYSMDVEIANLLSRYNMKVVGDKEFLTLSNEQKQQTLWVRIAMTASSKKVNLITISFDDAVTGKTVASLTARAYGDMFDPADRTAAIEKISKPLVQALERDKGLNISDSMKK